MTKRIDIYPLTIIADRYSGTYSGARFTAWNDEYDNLPTAIHGSDIACALFWDDYTKTGRKNLFDRPLICGKGNTIEQAYNDLLTKLQETKP